MLILSVVTIAHFIKQKLALLLVVAVFLLVSKSLPLVGARLGRRRLVN
jgi:hypothetical protein